MKKGSMELGVNSIVVLIIAMAVLGLIIFFIYDKLSNPDIPQLPVGDPRAPSFSEPITFVTSAGIGGIIGKPSEQLSAKFAVMNTGEFDMGNTSLTLDCGDIVGEDLSTAGKDIAVGKSMIYSGILTMPTGSAQKYVCQLTATSTDAGTKNITQDVFVEIK